MTEPMGIVPTSSFLDSLGARGQRRAEPRASIAIAGAGCALAVVGAMIVAGDSGASGSSFNRVPGIILSALVVAAGLFTLSLVRTGAIATAGAVATALGVPPLVFFVTFSQGSFPPYSTDAILIVSSIAWLAAYTVGPGRGRPFFLGAGLLGLWFTFLQVTERVFESPFGLLGFGGWSSYPDGGRGDGRPFDPGTFDGASSLHTFHRPDPTTLGLISLGLGVGYLLVCRWLDRRGSHGVATPFAFAALPTLFVGTGLLVDDLEQAGTGLLLLVVGVALTVHGASVGRRATAWLGGGAAAIGTAVFLSDMTDDATTGGLLFMAAGIALVAAGHAVAMALSEPDEMATTTVREPVSIDATTSPDERNTEPDDRVWAPPPEDLPPEDLPPEDLPPI